MSPPDVSVVITTRNRRGFLAQAVDSVLRQTGPALELTIIDDASDDGSSDSLRAHAADPRVRIVRNPVRMERSFSRNAGLSLSTGWSVMFLDDDDVLLPGALARLFAALRSHPAAVASCGARIDWCPISGAETRRRDSHVRLRATRRILPELVFGWSAVSGQNLYRLDAARRSPGFRVDLASAEDRLFWMEIARQGPVVLVPEAVMLYRLHDHQYRPPDIARIRRRVFRLGMHMAHGTARRNLIRARASAKKFEEAEAAFRRLRFAPAAASVISAILAGPTRTLFSPLIFPWIVRRLLRSLRQGFDSWRRGQSAG